MKENAGAADLPKDATRRAADFAESILREEEEKKNFIPDEVINMKPIHINKNGKELAGFEKITIDMPSMGGSSRRGADEKRYIDKKVSNDAEEKVNKYRKAKGLSNDSKNEIITKFKKNVDNKYSQESDNLYADKHNKEQSLRKGFNALKHNTANRYQQEDNNLNAAFHKELQSLKKGLNAFKNYKDEEKAKEKFEKFVNKQLEKIK
jgi:hypothetical protein